MHTPLDRRRFLVTALPGAALLTACASSSSGGRRSNSNLLTAEDLADHTQDSLFEAVRRLRSNWLRRRGAGTSGAVDPVQVFTNGSPYGGVSALENIRVTEVVRVEYMNGADATTRFGTGHGGGVILVTTR